MPTLLTPKDRTICVCALFYLLLFLAASAARAQDTQTKIKPVPCTPTSAASGEQILRLLPREGREGEWSGCPCTQGLPA
jgi:hypothetical protein